MRTLVSMVETTEHAMPASTEPLTITGRWSLARANGSQFAMRTAHSHERSGTKPKMLGLDLW